MLIAAAMVSFKLKVLIRLLVVFGLCSAPLTFAQEPEPSPIPYSTIAQKLDYSGSSDQRTLNDRYVVFSKYADNDFSPVIYVFIGEEELSPMSENDIDSGFDGVLAKQFHAHLVYIEHRYYGQSTPRTSSARSLFLLSFGSK